MRPYFISPTQKSLDLGQTWYIAVRAESTATVSVVVTTSAGGTTSPTATYDATCGEWRATYTPSAAGRYIATVTVTDADSDFGDSQVLRAVSYVGTVVGEAAMPDRAEVVVYLGETSFSDAELDDALAAEAAAQRARCRIPAAYPADLRQALLRRVARNLAARSVPVASFTSFDGGGTATRVPMLDPEILRLEAPYRHLVVG